MCEKWKVAGLAACLLGAFAGSARAQGASPAPLKVLVNPGDSSEQSRVALFSAWKAVIEQSLRRQPVHVALSNDATADLGATRARLHDIYIAPAHVVGSAVRYGYQPVMGLDRPVQAVLVAPKDSPVNK